MNLRYEILKACAANPGAPVAEICDSIKHDRQKTTWAARDCAKAGLLSMRRDDVTGQPGYTLTAEGKQRLAEGPGSKQGGYMTKADSDSEGGETDVMAAARQSGGIPPDESKQELATREIPPPQYDPNEVAFKRTGEVDVIRTLADARLRELVQAAETLAPCVPGAIDTSDMELQEIADRVVAGVTDLTARLESKDEELLKQAAVVVDLRAQLETMQREAMRGATCLSGQDRYTAAGYLVRASKRKPRTLLDKDKARDAALSSIRAGAQRAEVFALVPIGHARRGAEWRSA